MNHYDDRTQGPYRRLPDDVMALLLELQAPPRLIAHLSLVHDMAWNLTAQLEQQFPQLKFDRDAVLYGAATHDIGKAEIRSELSQPGSLHEAAGFRILSEKGVEFSKAIFARDHSDWMHNNQIENLLVALEDKIWKGKRVPELETLVFEKIALCSDVGQWEVFIQLDELLELLTNNADARLLYQAEFPV